MSAPTIAPEFAAEAAAIDAARTTAFEVLHAATVRGLTGYDLIAFETTQNALTHRCEALRLRFYPLSYQLLVVGGAAMPLSHSGRRIEVIWHREGRP